MRYRTRLFINLNILAENFHLLKEICPNNQILFMVKANGYGHGMIPIVRFSILELGIKEFGCATLGEARLLREELSDLNFEIYVFSDMQFELQSCLDLYLTRRIIPVISNIKDLDFILQNKDFQHVPLCLKFNTGMNRLGLVYGEMQEIVKKLKFFNRKSVYHLMSHFSSAFTSIGTKSITVDQYNLFLQIKKYFHDSGIEIERTSIANSGAIEQKFALKETHVRPGLMLYGPSSLDKQCRSLSCWEGKNISSLETNILHVFKVKKGTRIGYGATPCPADGTIALIALGYGDGFSQIFEGTMLPYYENMGEVFGKVNMDMAQIFFAEEEKISEKLRVGKLFTIWGHDPSEILRFSDQTKIIPYELFCQLTTRVPRIYGLDQNLNRIESNL